MRWVLEPVIAPDLEPVTLERMKRELDEFSDVTERDDDITAKIVAGRRWAERYTGQCMVDQTWRLSVMADTMRANDLSVWTPITGSSQGDFEWRRVGEIFLRKTPILAVTAFVSVDIDGEETAVDAETYEVREADSKWPRLVAIGSATWTAEPNLRIAFRAGYAERTGSPVQDATVIPEDFKQAVILWVKWNYNGEKEAMDAAKAILNPYRTQLGFA